MPRVLRENSQGGYAACGVPGTNTETYRHSGFGVATDHLWLKKSELGQLSKLAREKPGQKVSRYSRHAYWPASTSWTIHVVNRPTGAGTKSRKLECRTSPVITASGSPYRNAFRIAGKFHLETRDGKRGYQGENRRLHAHSCQNRGVRSPPCRHRRSLGRRHIHAGCSSR